MVISETAPVKKSMVEIQMEEAAAAANDSNSSKNNISKPTAVIF